MRKINREIRDLITGNDYGLHRYSDNEFEVSLDEIEFEDEDDYSGYYDDDYIEELDFSVRTYNCLRRAGITKVSELKK